MSYEDQLGALAAKLRQAREEAEVAVVHVREVLHGRIDKLEGEAAADIAALESRLRDMEEGVLTRLTDIEDGILRHRDQLRQGYDDLVARILTLEAALERIIGSKP